MAAVTPDILKLPGQLTEKPVLAKAGEFIERARDRIKLPEDPKTRILLAMSALMGASILLEGFFLK